MSLWNPPFLVKTEPLDRSRRNSLEENDAPQSDILELKFRTASPISSNHHQFRSDDVLDVTCGMLTGKLHFRMFLCPGIHQHCIQIDGTTDMVSPKDFTIRACKDRQKDWKGSIRVGKRSIRMLMELGLIDYFNHQDFCSLKCQSRNHMKGRPSDLRSKSKHSAFNETPVPLPSLSIPIGSYSGNTFFLSPNSISNLDSGTVSIFPAENVPHSNILNNNNNTTITYDLGIGDFSSMINSPDQQFMNLLHIDPVSFWRELHRVNIITDVVDRIMNRLKDCAAHEDIAHVAMNLSRVVTALNLQYDVVQMFNDKQWSQTRNIPMEANCTYHRTTRPSEQDEKIMINSPGNLENSQSKDDYFLL